jgi:sterol desaturase/sphingolipid hydroxylase (fatty acid hydroxylase superfamily)
MGRERPLGMETILGILVPVTFVSMLIIERLFPGRPLPRVRFWALKGVAFFVMCAVLAAIVPAVLSAMVGSYAPFHVGLPLIPAALLGYLAGDVVNYGVHRLMHNVPLLWRWTHQIHHSEERVDMWGANYFHPFDLILQVTATTLPVLAMGLSPAAAALGGYVGFVFGMFPHLNVRTPQWLGYVVQRPEAHAVHHTRGVHAYNYGTFPLWDIVFGTFRNPAKFSDEPAGFWDGSSRRLGAMLIGRDVSAPPQALRDA